MDWSAIAVAALGGGALWSLLTRTPTPRTSPPQRPGDGSEVPDL
jgi:hypothetical protein